MEFLIAWLKANHLYGVVKATSIAFGIALGTGLAGVIGFLVKHAWEKRNKKDPQQSLPPVVVNLPPPPAVSIANRPTLTQFDQDKVDAIKALHSQAQEIFKEVKEILHSDEIYSPNPSRVSKILDLLKAHKEFAYSTKSDCFSEEQRDFISVWIRSISGVLRPLPLPKNANREDVIKAHAEKVKRYKEIENVMNDVAVLVARWREKIENPPPLEMPTVDVSKPKKRLSKMDRHWLACLIEIEDDFKKVFTAAEIFVSHAPRARDRDELDELAKDLVDKATLLRDSVARMGADYLEIDWKTQIIVWVENILITCGFNLQKRTTERIVNEIHKQHCLNQLNALKPEVFETINAWRSSIRG